MYAIQYLRSLIFVGQMYLMMPVVGLLFFPWAVFSRRGAILACRTYAHYCRWSAGWMVGLKTEVRGTPPTGECLIAAKHQSFLDILMIYSVIPSGKFIMKKSLRWAPVLGQYGMRIGCVPVDRGKRSQAVKQMVADVAAGRSAPGQLIIYSQGTRVAPGVKAPYKIGTAVLYDELGQECVPVAVNVGVFWPRTGIYRKPGTAVIEFLDPIPAGLPKADFMQKLESVVETRSNELMREAGFDVED